jgi:hypothetical protein
MNLSVALSSITVIFAFLCLASGSDFAQTYTAAGSEEEIMTVLKGLLVLLNAMKSSLPYQSPKKGVSTMRTEKMFPF